MADKKTQNQAPVQAEAVMYIGPAKRGALHVTKGAVFRGGVLPDHLAKAIKAKGNEFFKAMFVPVSEAGKARVALRDPNSDLAKDFKSAAAMEG